MLGVSLLIVLPCFAHCTIVIGNIWEQSDLARNFAADSGREARPHQPLSVADFPCGKDERYSGGAREG